MHIQSLPSLTLLFYISVQCAASEPAHWTNSSSILSTRTSSAFAIPGVNIKPPLSLLTGSSYASSYTGTPTYNYFTAIESYASTTYGPAVFNHTTFQSVCPLSPRSSARACYSTCTSFANACRELHSSWSGKNGAFQSSMNEKHFGGSSSRIGHSVSTHTEQLSTIWTYDISWATTLTTVDILGQFGESQKVYPTKISTVIDGVSTTLTSTATQKAVEVETESQAYAVGGTGQVVSVKTLDNYLVTSTNYYSWSFTEPKPQCSPTTWSDCQFRTDCDKCTISGGTVRLLYFPVSRTTDAPVITAPTSAKASPKVAIYGNTTLTSPSVYISFNTAYAMNACGTQIGRRYPGAILALNPNSLSSINMIWGTMYSTEAADPFASGSPYLIASSFNLADMGWPVPASAYMAQPKCQNGAPWGECSVVLDDYNPLLEVPKEVRAMDPAWRSCELDWQGLYDPPTALQPAEAMAKPTTSSGVAEDYTSAKPQSTPTSPPVETSMPQGTMQFSEPVASHESSTSAYSKAKEDPTGVAQDPASPTTISRGDSSVPTLDNPVAFSEAPSAIPTTQAEANGDSASIGAGLQSSTDRIQSDPVETVTNVGSSAAVQSSPRQVTRVDASGEGTNAVSTTAVSPAAADPSDPAQTDLGVTEVTTSEAADGAHSSTVQPPPSSSSKIGTVFVDSTGGANVIFDSSTIAAGQLSTESGVDGPTVFIGSESGTFLTRTLQSLRPASTTELGGQDAEPKTSQAQASLESHPLIVAINSQTLTEGGSALTVSGQVASLASNGIVVGSRTIDIPQIQAGTQHIALPVGSDSALVGMTFIAGDVTASPSSIGQSEAEATSQSAGMRTSLASTIPRAIFTFGTHTYTAIKTAGPSQAVVDGKTLSIGGAQVSLDGGNVSLRSDGQLAMQSDPPTSASSSASDVTIVNAAAITLDSATLTAVHPSGARKGVVEVDGTTLSPGGSGLVVGDATVSAMSNGVVTLANGSSGTVTLSKTTLTKDSSKDSASSSLASDIGPLTPSATSGIGYVQTASSSPSSTTSGASRRLVCWETANVLVIGFAVSLHLFYTV